MEAASHLNGSLMAQESFDFLRALLSAISRGLQLAQQARGLPQEHAVLAAAPLLDMCSCLTQSVDAYKQCNPTPAVAERIWECVLAVGTHRQVVADCSGRTATQQPCTSSQHSPAQLSPASHLLCSAVV